MKIFVLGASGTGKSPLARRTAEALGIPCHGASAWVRERWPKGSPVDEMTTWATEQLRRDPGISVKSLRRRADLDAACVIEGMRNPYDFVTCFDPRSDLALFLELDGHAPRTSFDEGVDVIEKYLFWLAGAGIMDTGHMFHYGFSRFGELGVDEPDTLEHAIVDFIAQARSLVTLDRDPAAQQVHAQVPPIETHVRAEYLYGMDPARAGELRPCRVFAVSSYTGSTPTFQILLPDGAVFSYVPPSALVDPSKRGEPLELADLVYHDCKSTPICVQSFDALRGRVLAYFKRKDLWLGGEYLFTIDWFTTNELMHVLALDNGQYALLPSHKVKFGDHAPGFEPYRKIRREWTVE